MSDDLIAKYGDARVPRYTSYPTAAAFSAAVGPDEYAGNLAHIAAAGPVSVYLHVPFCRSICWYCGCHTTITRQDAPVADYLDVMKEEIELVSFAAGNDVPVKYVHFGGGTPSVMKPQEFSALMAKLRSAFTFEAKAGVAVEIDPRTLVAPMIDALAENGVDRASLGVQSYDPIVQAGIKRLQSFEQTERAVAGLRSAGVSSINFDLIYGLPKQTVQSCIETVRLAAELRPERFAVFGYAHIPAFKKHQRLIDEASLPDAKQRNEQAEVIAEELQKAGYLRIGLDHFALPNDQLALAARNRTLRRNFQGYTTDDCDSLIGLGASAIGRLPAGYMQNHVPLGLYAERIAFGVLPTAKGYLLSEEDKLRARVIERLMCDFEADLGQLSSGSGFDTGFLVERNDRLGELMADGVVTISGERIVVCEEARFMVRAVAAAFDAYFSSHGHTHSKAA
ncbi:MULTISPECIES: oxygen-independent coproporphyrinogen III oxidase [Rhizobium]|jgi:oxygen-independent coproporphyrinogen-3 oxidase|uniref:Coproporphyrinogen-III oxidase n=2 Tax=Rhizobium TaxID=379 RepID=B3Q2Y2_RHIE6|nr:MULTISPECIES: oxygen-independent coproporphyrinogen III oxidase [Rhizobium]ACE94038.1 oxygen-independent coprophorphyrinogen III oxidase protein [Rhizobium etli CIAT 652]KEC70617.1 coproporphyrinogen III oxidase [Rhizobium leguminosarum bv. phaseoli CCGM1]ANK94369.1 coproporphyrinogen III oxidase 3 [Rhizobium sp. N6212]ANL00419.1 coproporphyrinogen III oxidase 3 [Rhizobium sp. N621]ANL68911.1 coproporphyrinogen III oxidase 3 [Rhizobium phaseoli]